jgi:hypothetical protein
LLRHLEAIGFHTNRVLTTKAGSYFPHIQGKPMILKTWIPGVTLRDSVQSDFRSIGRAIADLHQIPAPSSLRREHPYGLNSMADACGQGNDLEYETWLAEKIAYLHDNFPLELPRVLIHGDLLMTISFISRDGSRGSLLSGMPAITSGFMILASSCLVPAWWMEGWISIVPQMCWMATRVDWA